MTIVGTIGRVTARDTTSASVRVLEAVRRFFRANGCAPSYREIAALAGVSLNRVGGYLDDLQRRGFLTHAAGVARSIVMVDRTANLSDAELELGCHGRNWTIVKPPPIVATMFDVYPVDRTGTDCPADFSDLLMQVDAAAMSSTAAGGGVHGEAAGQEDQGIVAGGDRRTPG